MANSLLVDGATLYSANNTTAYPVTNLLSSQPRDFVRTIDNTDWYVEIDLGAAYAINVVGFLYTNMDINMQWQISAGANQASLTASPLTYTSGPLDPALGLTTWNRIHGLHFMSTAQTYRWWRIDVSGITTYLQAGRLIIDAAYVPTTNVAVGASLGVTDYSFGVSTPGGHYRRPGKQQRNLSVTLHARTESESYTELLDFDRRVGQGGDVLVCLNPDAYIMERTLYGYASDIGDLVHQTYIGSYSGIMHQKNYSFEEYDHP